MIEGLIGLLAAQLAGTLLAAALGLPIPGPVLGLVLLLAYLLLRRGPPPGLNRAAQTLLAYLPLILIPPSVGLMEHLPLLARQALLLVAVIVGSTLLSLIVCGWLGQRLLGRHPPGVGGEPASPAADPGGRQDG